MTSPRDRILAAVADSLTRAELPDAARERPELPPAPGAVSIAEMADGFERGLTALTGQVVRADSPATIADAIAGIARDRGATTYVSWDDAEIGCPGLNDALGARGLVRVAYDLPFDAGGREDGVQGLAGVVLGVTGADAALADCGGIVLTSGPGYTPP